ALPIFAAAFEYDVRVRLEQADDFFAGRHRFAVEHPPPGLRHDTLDQGQVMADFAAPTRGGRPDARRQPLKRALQRRLGGTRGRDQLAIQLRLPLLAAAVLDGVGTLFGQPAVIAPAD